MIQAGYLACCGTRELHYAFTLIRADMHCAIAMCDSASDHFPGSECVCARQHTGFVAAQNNIKPQRLRVGRLHTTTWRATERCCHSCQFRLREWMCNFLSVARRRRDDIQY